MALDGTTSISDDVDLLADVANDDKSIEKPVRDEVIVEDEPEIDVETDETPESDDEPEEELESTDEKPSKKEYLPHERPPISAIKKEFPELFKKFPQLEHMYFREKEYTEIFPTVADAKEANEAAEALTTFRDDLFTGDGSKFVSALKDADELGKFSKGFLTNLQKIDKDAYWDTIVPTLQNLVTGFFREGQSRNDANYIASAENLAIYLFGSAEFAQGKRSAITTEPKEDKRVEERLANIDRKEYNTFRINTLEGISNGLKPLIDLTKSGLSKTMQELISDKIMKEVDDSIGKDSIHMKYVNSLWNKAKGNYTEEQKSKIISAYLERAKSLVPSIRRRLLSEALGTSPEESKRKLEKVAEVKSRREPGSQGKPAGSSVRAYNPKAIDYGKTSDMDILNGNVTLKTGRK